MADRHTSTLRVGTGVASLLYRCSRSCLAEACDGQEAPRSPHFADLLLCVGVSASVGVGGRVWVCARVYGCGCGCGRTHLFLAILPEVVWPENTHHFTNIFRVCGDGGGRESLSFVTWPSHAEVVLAIEHT